MIERCLFVWSNGLWRARYTPIFPIQSSDIPLNSPQIQELNYKITVLLNSDSKSEIEGLRWVLTRRSVMGILFMAFMVLTSLRYASYKSHEDEMKQKKKEEVLAKFEGHTEDLPAQGAAEILAAN